MPPLATESAVARVSAFAEKLPEASRATSVDGVFALVAFVPIVIPVEPLYDVPVR